MSRRKLLHPCNWPFVSLLCSVLALGALAAAEEAPGGAPRVDGEGTAHLPSLEVPASRFMSPAARAKFITQFSHAPAPEKLAAASAASDPQQLRDDDEQKNAPLVARAEALWPVTIQPRVMGGVRTRVITPKAGVSAANRDRVLINLHGGGFIWGEGNGALTESIPIAGVGRITVITVAYRLAPEFAFPAASRDVAAVYRELLRNHRAKDIGI
jgi:monoterpene epsilon-lactone hydrolase